MSKPRFSFRNGSDLLGAHISTKGGLATAFERATAIGAEAMAIFSRNSNQWNAKPLSDEERAGFRAAHLEAGARPLMVHASYLINLATTNPLFLEKSIQGMLLELDRAERLGAYALVLHPGAHMGAGADQGLDQIARSLDQIHRTIPENKVITLLETAAGQGSCVGCTFEELGSILKRVDDPSRLGVCFDTCHVFASGYDLRTADGYERAMDEAEEHVGLGNIGAFHLNDSKRDLGSRVDRHEHIGEGFLGLDAFGRLLNDSRFSEIPKVLETPKPEPLESDIRNLTRLRSMLA